MISYQSAYLLLSRNLQSDAKPSTARNSAQRRQATVYTNELLTNIDYFEHRRSVDQVNRDGSTDMKPAVRGRVGRRKKCVRIAVLERCRCTNESKRVPRRTFAGGQNLSRVMGGTRNGTRTRTQPNDRHVSEKSHGVVCANADASRATFLFHPHLQLRRLYTVSSLFDHLGSVDPLF